MILSKRCMSTTMPPNKGTGLPSMLVPAPRAVTGILPGLAIFMMAEISCAEPGMTTTWGGILGT